MKNKCVNYGFWMIIALPILGILFSLGLLYASILWAIILFLLCASMIVTYVLIEPTSYIIDEKGVTIICGFKRAVLSWNAVTKIEIYYDPMFRLLFMKHYVLYQRNCKRPPKRKECIIKTKKTTKLLKAYYPGRVTDF